MELGVNVIIVGGPISDINQHFLERYGLMVLRCPSKFELLRICKLINAKAITHLREAKKDELGYCTKIQVKEIGSTKVTLFQKETSNLCTVIIRGATQAILDDVARALENGVSVYKSLFHDGRVLNGGGAIESYLVN